MRRFSLPGLVAVTAIAVSAMGVRADIGTSMTPGCLNPECTEVVFTLTLVDFSNASGTAPFYLQDLYIRPQTGDWTFDTSDLHKFSMKSGGFTIYGDSDDLKVETGDLGLPGAYPAFNGSPMPSFQVYDNTVVMTVAFVEDEVNNPYWEELRYDGDFISASSNDPDSYSGTVTPEPATLLLLGTGLLGIAGVARRRKNLHQDGEEEL